MATAGCSLVTETPLNGTPACCAIFSISPRYFFAFDCFAEIGFRECSRRKHRIFDDAHFVLRRRDKTDHIGAQVSGKLDGGPGGLLGKSGAVGRNKNSLEHWILLRNAASAAAPAMSIAFATLPCQY